MFKKYFLLFLVVLSFISCKNHINSDINNISEADDVDKFIREKIKEGRIPGLSCVIVNQEKVIFKNFGYSNTENKIPVTSQTLFELGSCSKSFTALAILKLESEGKILLDENVTNYLSWFKVYYNDSLVDITLRQLLHHTSGIPWYTISLIPEGNQKDALFNTIKQINGISLHKLPGKQYEYATINYDILALIIESISGKSFETYLVEELLDKLDLKNTFVGCVTENPKMASGYKNGFFRPRSYTSPNYKGNNAAAYVISNAEDVSKWLKYQMGLIPCKYDSLFVQSHTRDESVMPHNLSSYANGWFISLKGDGEIFHGGLNPNFTSYIAFRKTERIGVAVLANSNSSYTQIIGQNVLKILAEEDLIATFNPNDSNDKAFSVLSIILSIYLIFIFSFFVYIIYGIIKRKRAYEPFSFKKIVYIISVFVFLIPFLYGIYLIPKAMAGFSWESAIVWSPISLPTAVLLCIASISFSYLVFLISVIFPEKDKYLREAPKIILLSILSGLSNMVVILLITSSLRNTIELKFILYYFILTMIVYLLGRKIVQTKMIYLTRNIIYDLRMKLISKVFSTSYEKFEKIDRGRIYTTMNDDIGTIGDSANTFVNITTSIITAGGAFLYMATLAFWATLVTLLLVGTISSIYYIVSRKTHILFEDARETRTVYMRLLNGMIDGFKELSIHRNKKLEYKNDVEISTDEYRKKICMAHVKFVNAFLVGESLLIVLLATVAFAIPRVFPDVQYYTVMSFVIILLYLIGPVNAILSSIPQLMQLKIAWSRVQSFIDDIPANLNLKELASNSLFQQKELHSIKVQSVTFKYKDNNNKEGFSVGPISLEVKKGEALFIIGGNGSGKTTLAKLLTGLYTPKEGGFFIDGKKIESNKIGEYFSTVFNPLHLFKKLYNIDLNDKTEDLIGYMASLQLKDKVNVIGNEYSTIELSGGQRKRLALLQCYLEDKPIYLFDEWAADQDPEYRKFFYRELIIKMKAQGKIIIAITHDDHYFDVADKILKLDMGKVEFLKNTHKFDKGIYIKN